MEVWTYHDKRMQKLKKIYQKISKQTQNKLQEIFDSCNIDFSNLYNIADTKTKNKVNTYIEEWKDKGLLTGYFGMLANNIYKRTRVKNSEILELLIYGAYIEEQNKLEETELNIFKDITNYYYQEGQQEVNKTLPKNQKKNVSVITDAIFLSLMNMQNSRGYIWNQYIEVIIKYNADQIYRQCLINIQQGKENNISDSIYQNIIKKQQNSKLCINGNKISGAVDNQLIGLNNQAKIEGYKKILEIENKTDTQNDLKVMFLAVEDEKTTEMCKSLDGQIFNVYGNNEFNRYYGETQKELRIVKIRCKGLLLGVNLPPISHHFHYCRSTIMYLPPVAKKEKTEYNNINYPSYIRLNVNKNYKAEDEIDLIVNSIIKMPSSIRKLIEDTDFEVFSKGKVYRNNEIIKNSFYDRKENKIYIMDGKGLTEGEVIHEIAHAVETKLNILDDNNYIKIRNKGLENYNKNSIKYNNELNTDCITSSKFVSELQGKIYNKDLKGNYRTYSNGNLNTNCLGDYFSEGFREYIENSNNLLSKDKELFEYIRGIVNGI